MAEAIGKTALIFPGQGSHTLKMWRAVEGDHFFREHYGLLCDIAGKDLVANIARQADSYLKRNEVASLLTVFVSACCLDRVRQQSCHFDFTAGYSVGQWSAIYAANACSLEQLLRIVRARALLMNNALAAIDTGMLAVIGLDREIVQRLCAGISNENEAVTICNINAPRQLTVGGHLSAIEKLEPQLRAQGALKVMRLSVSGAWHCWLLESAVPHFQKYLSSEMLSLPVVSVADNVTGDFLPATRESMLCQLSRQLSAPVQWERCIRQLISAGAEHFLEVGYGNMLSKFGFFIDRNKRFQALIPS